MLAQVEGQARAVSGGHDQARDGPARGECRIGELASAAGVSVRTVRYYQERRLLPPPRRDGRIAWYSQAHLTRLRIIGGLLERGHTLGGAGELLSAWEQGYDLATLLGIEEALTAPWSREMPVPLTVDEISELVGAQFTPEVLQEAVRLGYVGVDGGRVIHVSRRLLDTTKVLVGEGIPLRAILAAGREVQGALDKLASVFVDLVLTSTLGRSGGPPRPQEVARLAEMIDRLRPVARTVIETEFARAMDRRSRVTYSEFMRSLAAPDRPAAADAGGTATAAGGESAAR
jgi:DNA-binding transcriptional MerR regulator